MKTALRNQFRRLRESLSAQDVTTASDMLCRRLSEWSLLQDAAVVLTYLAFRNEPDLSALFTRLAHIRWVVPRVDGRFLSLHEYHPGRLVRHRYGMWEPAADLPTVDAAQIDLVLTPGVAFDRRGGRLGFGGGFYDRLLPTTPALRVGIAYDVCLTEALPMGERDQWMDWIATPAQLIHCRRPPAPASNLNA